MNKATYILAGILLLSTALLSSCERRPLDEDYYNGAMVQVNIDWGTITPQPEHIKMWFYPTASGSPVFRFISSQGEQIQVPYNTYHALLYTWRSNSDMQTIKFEGNDSDTTFRAYTDFSSLKSFSTAPLMQPDSLYAWNCGNDIIAIDRTGNTQGAVVRQGNTIIINTKPKSLVYKYSFFIPVDGLEYTTGANAAMSGVARYKNVYTQELSAEPHNMMVTVSQEGEGIRCSFSVLGFVPNESHKLTINFGLIDGTVFTHEEDLSEAARRNMLRDLTKPIVIPRVSGGGFKDPGISDWQEIVQPIEI